MNKALSEADHSVGYRLCEMLYNGPSTYTGRMAGFVAQHSYEMDRESLALHIRK